MNPFAEQAANMKAYEQMCSEPVSAVAGENTITIASGTYPAVVGPFIRRDILIDGGVSPHLMGEVIVQKACLPAGTTFAFGQTVTAIQIGGGAHVCQVFTADDTFTEWRLVLRDVNEGA